MSGDDGLPGENAPEEDDGLPDANAPEEDDGLPDANAPGEDGKTVVAQGTFDLVHPGHVHYLREAAAMGDSLVVIVARRENVTHKDAPVVPGHQRRDVVAALDPVDEAILGDDEDIFAPIEALDPDIIALGYDQHHDADAIRGALAERGIDCAVRRASARDPENETEILSSGTIIERILARYCEE